MTEEKEIKVRDGEAEIVVKDGKKEFRYSRNEEGKLQIVSTKGLKEAENPRLLNRLLNAKPDNCSRCLEAEIRDSMTFLFFMNFLEEEDIFSFV